MKKEALQVYAVHGVRFRVAAMERELASLFKEFPQVFAGPTPPALLRPEPKVNGNDWPAVTAETIVRAKDAAKGWTPERRRKAALALKKRRPAMDAAKRRKALAEKGGTAMGRPRGAASAPWGTFAWQRAHDYLLSRPTHTASTPEILAGAKISSDASFITGAYNHHKDVFARISPGKYKLKKVVQH